MAPSVRLRRAGLIAVALSSLFLLSACTPPGRRGRELPRSAGRRRGRRRSTWAQGPTRPASRGDEEEEAEEAVDPMEPNDEPLVVWWADGGQLAAHDLGQLDVPGGGRGHPRARAGRRGQPGRDRASSSIPPTRSARMDFVPHTTLFWTPVRRHDDRAALRRGHRAPRSRSRSSSRAPAPRAKHEQVADLAVERLADRLQGREADGPCPVVLQHAEVHHAHADELG